jgi:hypothetical protein
VNANDFLYQKDMIIKGILIMREFLDYLLKINNYVSITEEESHETKLEESIKNIIIAQTNPQLEDIWISVVYIPFFEVESSIYQNSPRKDVLGAFSSALPDAKNLIYKAKYMDPEDFCRQWVKTCQDGSAYKVRVSADINFYYMAKHSWNNDDFLIQYNNILRHELTHFTQFINSLCLKIFESCRDNLSLGKIQNSKTKTLSSISLRRILAETISSVLKNQDIKVGVPKTSFLKKSTDMRNLSKVDFSLDYKKYYHNSPDEFKTWMSDQTRISLQNWISRNKAKWELAKAGDAESIKSAIDWCTNQVLSIEDIQMIPNVNLKKKEIERLVKGIFSGKF